MKDDGLERDLRELFDRKASEGATAPRAPDRVVRRSRRRQAGVVAMSAVTVVALLGVSFAGLRALDRGRTTDSIPADVSPYDTGRYPIFERSAEIHGLRVTSPSDWYLVNQWALGLSVATSSGTVTCSGSGVAVPADGSFGASGSVGSSGSSGETCETSSPEPVEDVGPIPVLQLSNRDFGLAQPVCGLGDIPPLIMTGDDAVMAVVIDTARLNEGMSPPWLEGVRPVEIDGSGDVVDGICGPGFYTEFDFGGGPYIAWASFGPEVTEEDRQVALGSLADAGGGVLDRLNEKFPSYVLASGDNAAGPWRLELRPSDSSRAEANIDLTLIGTEGSPGAKDFAVPDEHAIEQTGGDPVFGVVTKEAAGVVLRQESRLSPIPAQLIPLPPSLPFAFDIFMARNEMDAPAEAVALGPDGNDLGHGDTSPPQEASASNADGTTTITEGQTLGVQWAIDYRDGRQLLLGGREDTILYAEVAPRRFDSLSVNEPLAIASHEFGDPDSQERWMLIGATHHEVNQLDIVIDGGEVITLGAGTMKDPSIQIYGQNPNTSPGIWWIELPSPLHAWVVTMDTGCQVLSTSRLDLGPDGGPEPPAPTSDQLSCLGP